MSYKSLNVRWALSPRWYNYIHDIIHMRMIYDNHMSVFNYYNTYYGHVCVCVSLCML